MVKVFRKFRMGNLAEGRFSRYMLYATGEIVLVVIGILIALAINNSNEERLKREKEQTYLAGLKNEFQISKLKLEELIRVNKQNYEGAIKIVEFISGETEPPGEKEFSELLAGTLTNDIAFNPNNSLLIEMINSGSLRDISNADLRIALTNWIATLEDISKQENELGAQRDQVMDYFRSGEQSLRTILDLTELTTRQLGISTVHNHKSNLNLLDSREFENNLFLFILTSQATETSHYLPLMQDLDSILDLLTREIKE
jgi:hypothetical protein